MTSTSTAVASMATPGSLEAVVLNSTNYYRQLYHAEPLVWNDTMAAYAENYARGCIWKHSGGPTGENLAASFSNSTLAIDTWAAEESKYNWKKAKFTHDTGHFTQLVWRNTTSVGCGLVACDNDAEGGVEGDYLVCEYWPPGNYKGDFKNNVVKGGVDGDGSPSLGAASGGRGKVWRMGVVLGAAGFVVAMLA
ncbi:Cell wall protein PRY3 [Fulvia fulva]|uniref:Cell wall protein PRY3 n=1 Tax=Passalora fulva TaxID=5499 RepID=A0A9Q8PIM4_PASFU|nr:Cell wall protein PRY3 [Fulvia fulva]KAK4616173.1 Cell wall protein PRY3 [Fulvia fulva]KAK4616505.1 Cell wall protein PRY3 [Fulvia fulva]UJO23116.1 Cell wall protein PRY3 [Fulvia fulva]WPV19189.1 Cell wall protein PRY3 [Fulvia fulva]WPV34704.1 Cell wall protein PRY3 [Fulvia fulva]